jgi:hypothetical protein
MQSGFLRLYFTLAWIVLQVFGETEEKSGILVPLFLVHSSNIWR